MGMATRECTENGKIIASRFSCEVHMEQTMSGMVIIGVGILSILGALLNWSIVVGSGKLIPRLLGPIGAKIFMIVAGLVIIGFGIGILLGLV
jgi:hypothetical protein